MALGGGHDAIQSVFPDTIVQLCIVHQIRNSIKYVGSKHQKEFLKDLKRVYGAVSKDAAETELLDLDQKWGEKYPIVIKSWQDNWEKLTEYFQFTSDIRRMIYTTNTVEGYHRQIRKVTKSKGVFPNEVHPKSFMSNFWGALHIATYARNGPCRWLIGVPSRNNWR